MWQLSIFNLAKKALSSGYHEQDKRKCFCEYIENTNCLDIKKQAFEELQSPLQFNLFAYGFLLLSTTKILG